MVPQGNWIIARTKKLLQWLIEEFLVVIIQSYITVIWLNGIALSKQNAKSFAFLNNYETLVTEINRALSSFLVNYFQPTCFKNFYLHYAYISQKNMQINVFLVGYWYLLSVLKAEVNRFQDTKRLLQDYYRAMESKIPLEDSKKFTRVPLVQLDSKDISENQLR